MTFLSTLLSPTHSSSGAFYLIQSSPAQSALPLLRGVINAQLETICTVVLVCSLYAPSNLLCRNAAGADPKADLKIVDWTDTIPGYRYGNDNDDDEKVNWKSRLKEVQDTFKGSSRAVSVIIDSVDTLDEDIESPSETYKFLQGILSLLNTRKDASRLICHITAFSPVLQLLKQPRFAPFLIYSTAHPPALLSYISRTYLASPPTSTAVNGTSTSSTSTPDTLRFWRVFVPLADRPTEIEALIFGPASADRAESGIGDGRGASQADEFVVDILVRGRGADLPTISTFPNPGSHTASGSGRGKRASVERLLEGWSVSKCVSVPLEELDSLRSLWNKKRDTVVSSEPEEPDPAKGLTFNLNLTESQQASRSQVPLPYERNGSKFNTPPEPNQSAHIFYDPDSADDLDDEDPDEDLDL